MKELGQCLEGYPVVMLEAIAEGNGLKFTAERKEELIEQLVRELLQPEVVARTLGSLSLQERQALDLVIAEGGRIRAYLLTRRYGHIRSFGVGSLHRLKPWQKPANPMERLYFLGYLFRTFGTIEDYHGEIFFIPTDLLPLLPQVEKPPIPFTVKTLSIPPIVREGSLGIVRDLFFLLSYLQREEVTLTKEGQLRRRDLRRLNQRFLVKEEPLEAGRGRPAFLRHLGERLSLMRLSTGILRVGPEARSWLKAPMLERIRMLWNQWRGDTRWNELWQVESLNCEPTGWQNDSLATRRRLLTHLRRCPPLTWLSLPSFVQAIKEFDPDFQRPDGDYDSWYIRDGETGRYLGGFQNWERVEGALIVHFITKPLNWLGLVSLGYSREGEDTPYAFLITNVGAAFLRLPHQKIVELPSRPLVVQANFEVLAYPETSLYDLFQLERFVELETEDVVNVYRITRDSVLRLLREGVETEKALRFLNRASEGKVPQNVALTMREWGQRFGEISLRHAVLLETRDENLLRELAASPEIAPYLRERISGRADIVAQEQVKELIGKLWKLGYMPKVESLEME